MRTGAGDHARSEDGSEIGYWGQVALRNCLRQAYNAGAPRAGTCSRTTTGLDAQGEPNMTFNAR